MRVTIAGRICIAVALLALPTPARSAEITDLTSAFDGDDPFDATVSLRYRRRLERGALRRETVGATNQTDTVYANELRYTRVEHQIAPRIEVGLFRDLQFHIELPIIISRSRDFDFAQNGGDPCGDPPETNCVTPNNSTLVRDGLVDGSQMAPDQVAVGNADGPPGGFLLPDRSGVDQLYLGLSWAAMNQLRTPTTPTWVLGFESRIAVGKTMTYNPADPEENLSVGRGVHELRFWTAFSRRFGIVDPWFALDYMLPIARDSSLYDRTTFENSGQRRSGPQHSASADLGLEITPWERPKHGHRFTIELGTRMAAIFNGRGYSPLWEVLARNPPLDGPCDPDPANATNPPPWYNGHYCQDKDDTLPHPGITHIDNYLTFTGWFGLNLRLFEHFQARLGLGLGYQQSHLVTTDDPGEPLFENGRVNPSDPEQVNPLFRDLIDTPGTRFKVDEATVFDVFASITALF